MADLSLQEKVGYVHTINTLWRSSMQYNQPENITPRLAEIIKVILEEIKEGSKAMGVVELTFGMFYIPATDWVGLALNTAEVLSPNEYWPTVPGLPNIPQWFDAIRGKRQYKAVVDSAALNWKSIVQMELMGL